MKPSAPASRALSVGMACTMDSRGCICRETLEPFREPVALNRGADARLSATEIEFRPSIALTDVSSELTRLSTGFQVHRQLGPRGNTDGVPVSSGLR
jgi:hypothetical protein